MHVYVINGPNLNLLGIREPEIYGTTTLDDIYNLLRSNCLERDAGLTFEQSNSEGGIVDLLHAAFAEARKGGKKVGVILNAGAYTHYSYAIRDAVAAIAELVPAIEVHLSNVHAREEFRHTSVIAPVCKGVIAGFGANSYVLALNAIFTELDKENLL